MKKIYLVLCVAFLFVMTSYTGTASEISTKKAQFNTCLMQEAQKILTSTKITKDNVEYLAKTPAKKCVAQVGIDITDEDALKIAIRSLNAMASVDSYKK